MTDETRERGRVVKLPVECVNCGVVEHYEPPEAALARAPIFWLADELCPKCGTGRVYILLPKPDATPIEVEWLRGHALAQVLTDATSDDPTYRPELVDDGKGET